MKHCTTTFAGVVAILMVLDGSPVFSETQDRIKQAIDPVMDVSGLWQGSWRLFGPSVHKQNGYIVAEFALRDGSRVRWRSPDFERRTLTDKFVQGRLPKLYDNLRRDRYRAAWRPFAEWVTRRAELSAPPVNVSLTRAFAYVPAPRFDGTPVSPPATHTHTFYRRTFTPKESAEFRGGT